MTVANGRAFLSIPGPTTIPDEVLQAMHRPAINIYTGELVQITASLLDDLRTVFKTAGRTYIYAANGHGAWEAALTNVLSRDDTILILESGRFATGWGEMGAMLGVSVETLASDWRHAVKQRTGIFPRLRTSTPNPQTEILTKPGLGEGKVSNSSM